MYPFLQRSLRIRSSQIRQFCGFLQKLESNSSVSLHHTQNVVSSGTYSYGCHQGLVFSTWVRFFSSEASFATDHSTSDGLTVQGILANNWNILEENDGDWKSHATAVAQSIHLIKRRLQVRSTFNF